MKLLAAFLVLLLWALAEGGKQCRIERGHRLKMFDGRELKLKMPCKYNAINQVCGRYKVTVTPGNRYLYPTYIIDSVWLSVEDPVSGLDWKGRTTRKMIAKYIVDNGLDPETGEDREAFIVREGNTNTSELFDITYSTSEVTLTEKSGAFQLSIGAYDFNGNLVKDSRMEFECLVENTAVPYPAQFCGTDERETKQAAIKLRTEELFDNKKREEFTLLFDIFNDTSIVQTEGACQETTRIMNDVCPNDDWRQEAIRVCHHILDSEGHTTCVFRENCDPMITFQNCMQFVCSEYKDRTACKAVGQAIDMCRDFGTLTEQVVAKDCFKDLMRAEDNPIFLRNLQKKKESKQSESDDGVVE